MHELKKRLEDVIELEGKIIDISKQILGKGWECVPTAEYGQVIDMIKDLADAKKNCLEACYYSAVIEAMNETEEYPEGSMGYDNWRYSTGRYAPKGRGHRSGFTPTMMQEPYIHRYLNDPEGFKNEMRKMGYNDHGGYTEHHPIDRYHEAKRYYHENRNDPDAKRQMEASASEHVGETLSSIREIWDDADPKMRVKLKEDFTKLIRDMDI